MKFLPDIPYPENEKPKLARLENLFRDWHQHFSSAGSGSNKCVADGMVFDGFYPHYFSQKTRVLFIGREARGIESFNNLEVLYPAYREGKRIGDQHLNANNFHSRMMYVAYGIVNEMPVSQDMSEASKTALWKKIPYASEIGDTFGEPNGLSFAFMNISKLSNESENWQSDWGVINSAHQLSSQGRTFNQEEVAILEPHIVITMNLEDKIASLGELSPIHSSPFARSFWLNSGGHRSLLIDTFHFTAPGKGDIEDFYVPICEAIRHSAARLNGLNRRIRAQ